MLQYNIIVAEIFEKFPAFMTAHNCILSWPRRIQSTFRRHVSLKFILVLPSYTCFGHPSNCFLSDFPAKILNPYLISPRLAKRVFHIPWFAHPNNIWWRVQIMKNGIILFFFFTTYCCFLLRRFQHSHYFWYTNFSRPQWPHGLRHEPSSPAWTLG
jgi:hypothetical protein